MHTLFPVAVRTARASAGLLALWLVCGNATPAQAISSTCHKDVKAAAKLIGIPSSIASDAYVKARCDRVKVPRIKRAMAFVLVVRDAQGKHTPFKNESQGQCQMRTVAAVQRLNMPPEFRSAARGLLACKGERNRSAFAAQSIAWAFAAHVDHSGQATDVMQMSSALNLPGGGGTYCGPVAATNGLRLLVSRGFRKINQSATALPRTLGSTKYMGTGTDSGTSPSALMLGLEKYLRDRGYSPRIQYEGVRSLNSKASKFLHRENISTQWVRDGIAPRNSFVLLGIGWYRAKGGGKYERIGGHWMTAVGFGLDHQNRYNHRYLLVHDPAKRNGASKTTHRLKMSTMPAGQLVPESGKTSPWLPRSTKGAIWLRDLGDFKTKGRTTHVVLESVVRVRL